MTIPPKVIEMAVQGGWKDFRPAITSRYIDDTHLAQTMQDFLYADLYNAQLIVDSTFWQALSKSCGWSNVATMGAPVKRDMGLGVPIWQGKAHRLLDLILTQQPTEKFWEEIISN